MRLTLQASFRLALYLLLVLFPLLVGSIFRPFWASDTVLVNFSAALGYVGFSIMALELVLVSRFEGALRRAGSGRLADVPQADRGLRLAAGAGSPLGADRRRLSLAHVAAGIQRALGDSPGHGGISGSAGVDCPLHLAQAAQDLLRALAARPRHPDRSGVAAGGHPHLAGGALRPDRAHARDHGFLPAAAGGPLPDTTAWSSRGGACASLGP